MLPLMAPETSKNVHFERVLKKHGDPSGDKTWKFANTE
jgi:hypothetical protein